MKKRFYSILTVLLCTVFANAQNLECQSQDESKQIWWNYYNNRGTWICDGSGKAERYYVATYIPYGFIGGEGTTIDGLSFYFRPAEMSDIQYWVSTALPEFGGEADLETVEFPIDEFKEGFNEMKFKESHIIPKNGLYVGCSFTTSPSDEGYYKYPINCRKSDFQYSQGFYYCTSSNTSWTTRQYDLYMLILSGGKLNDNSVKVFVDDNINTEKDLNQTIDVTLLNTGTNPVTNVRYVIETDGEQVARGTCNTSIQEFMANSTVSIPLPTDLEAEVHDLTITITEVNKNPNESADNKAEIKMYNMLSTPQFMPLFEEFTATWCGWCVRGIVAMNRAHEQYGDKAAIIAVHDDYAMRTEDYAPIIDKFCSSYPSGIANRKERTSISTNTVVDNIENSLNTITFAEIEADACWATPREIKVDTKTTFQLNMSGNYAIAYILTADGLTGWTQNNSYSGISVTDPDLQYWCEQPSSVKGVVYDHVVVAAWEPLYGVKGSVGSNIKAGEMQTYSFTVDISRNTIIQDKSKLKVITLLLNAETGEYINGAQTTIKAYDPNSIDEVETSTPEIIERYRLDGQRINAPERGINIIRMSDGTVRKVVIK